MVQTETAPRTAPPHPRPFLATMLFSIKGQGKRPDSQKCQLFLHFFFLAQYLSHFCRSSQTAAPFVPCSPRLLILLGSWSKPLEYLDLAPIVSGSPLSPHLQWLRRQRITQRSSERSVIKTHLGFSPSHSLLPRYLPTRPRKTRPLPSQLELGPLLVLTC